MPKGKFIVFEGIDGAGAETQSKRLFDYFTTHQIPANRISFPDYEGPIAKVIEDFLYKKFDLTPEIQFLLYATDMVKEKEKIQLWLAEGRMVVADRYFTTNLAYQGANEFPQDIALKFAKLFKLPKPDLVFYLSIKPSTSVQRKLKEKPNLDRYESNERFLANVHKSYQKLIAGNVFGQWTQIEGEQPADAVFAKVKEKLGLA